MEVSKRLPLTVRNDLYLVLTPVEALWVLVFLPAHQEEEVAAAVVVSAAGLTALPPLGVEEAARQALGAVIASRPPPSEWGQGQGQREDLGQVLEDLQAQFADAGCEHSRPTLS